jgi:hypothetical protein
MDTSISAGDHDKSSFPLHTEYNKYVRYITLLRTVYFITTSTIMLVCLQRFAYNSMLGSVAWLKQLCAMILLKYAAIRRLLTLLSDKLFNVSHYTVYRLLDKGIVEPIGPYGIVCLLRNILFVQAKMQTGFVYHYAGLIPSASNRGVPLPFLTVYY